jgi:hypothetical protein
VSDEADRFRMRARQCRELAKIARDQYSCDTLNGMAEELDAEAVLIDREEPLASMPQLS